MVFTSAADFLSGAVIPLPFLPAKIQYVIELLPFASMQNVPLRVYSGSMSMGEMEKAVFLQIFWLIFLVFLGQILFKIAERRVAVQGG